MEQQPPPPPPPKITLHIWPGKWNLPSVDPSCIAAFLYLQLTAPGQFAVTECVNPDLSPTGLLPFMTYECHKIASFPAIVKFVSNLKLQRTTAPKTNESSTSENLLGPAETVAWCVNVESNMGELVAYTQYSLSDNWWKLTKPTLASMLSIPQRYYVPERIRESFRPRLEAAGLWRTPPAEETEKKKPLMETFSLRRVQNENDQFSRVFDREKVVDKCRSFLDLYARLLDRGCLSSVRPTRLDILLTAHILLLVEPPFPDLLITNLLTESYPALIDYARSIRSKASETQPHALPAQGNTWRSLVPWYQSGSKPRKRSPEDIHFDRMRWGWMSLAAGSVATYLWTSGFIMWIARLNLRLVGDVSDGTPLERGEQIDEPEVEPEVEPEPEGDAPDIGDDPDAVSPEDLEILEEIAEQVDADDG